MSDVGQGPPPDRLATWLRLAESHASDTEGYRMYPGDWASLASTLREAIADRSSKLGDMPANVVVERERCIKIVREVAHEGLSIPETPTGLKHRVDICERIADRIRNG